MNSYQKYIALLIVLGLLIMLVFIGTYFVYNFNLKSFNSMQDTLTTIAKVQNKTKQARKASPDLKKASSQLLDYALKKDDSLFFLDYLEKKIKKVSTSSSIVSAQPINLDSQGYSILSLSIKTKASLENILSLLHILENIKYLSYIDNVRVEKLPKNEEKWQASVSLIVFTR